VYKQKSIVVIVHKENGKKYKKRYEKGETKIIRTSYCYPQLFISATVTGT